MHKKTTVSWTADRTNPPRWQSAVSDIGPLIHSNRWIKLPRNRQITCSLYYTSLFFTFCNMFSWANKDGKKKDPELFQTVSDGLKRLYRTKLFPLEDTYRFHDFHSPALEDADFDNKPMVLLVGQYSTGKTTFIRHLMEQDFPGMRIGPEPTTDSFIAVMYGEQEGLIPGNALVVDPKKPFRKLNAFGNAFLNRWDLHSLHFLTTFFSKINTFWKSAVFTIIVSFCSCFYLRFSLLLRIAAFQGVVCQEVVKFCISYNVTPHYFYEM